MNKYISYFTFLVVSLSVLLMASYTINRSIFEKSNAVRIASFIKTTSLPIAYVNDGNSAVLGTETDIEVATPPPGESNSLENKCEKKILSSNSIVNFLMEQNKDYTFEARIKMAKGYNIDNYTGSAEQNLLLIKLLNSENNNLCRVLN